MHSLFQLLQSKKKDAVRGSTIIELLVAVMIVGLIVVAVASATTYSIKNTGESRYRQVATTLGQQAMEHFRGRKNELGLKNYSDTLTAGANCYSNIESPAPGICGTNDVIVMAGTNFKRDVSIVKGGTGLRANPYYITFTVSVSWVDGSLTRQVELVQQLKQDSGFID